MNKLDVLNLINPQKKDELAKEDELAGERHVRGIRADARELCGRARILVRRRPRHG